MSVGPSVGQSVRPSVRPSVGPSVPFYFQKSIMAVLKGEEISNDIKNNGKISEDEEVASDVPSRHLFSRRKGLIYHVFLGAFSQQV